MDKQSFSANKQSFSANKQSFSSNKIDQLLTRGVEKIYPSKEALEKVLRSGKKLRVYNGIDPTSPKLHLGNAVSLLKLKEFQDLGHQVILLAGSFTAQIGDPSGHDEARKPLAGGEIAKNMADYKKQAGKILDFNQAEIKYNDEWLAKLSFRDVIKLASCFTIQQLIERDLFQKRLENKKPLWLHEFLYPLAQGYDSVALDVDLEVGATEQTFNMLAGRTLQKIYHEKEKFVLTTPILLGLDGRKMSKTFGNAVNLDDSPQEMFGKLMSLNDEMILPYFELCTSLPLAEVEVLEEELKKGKVNPMAVKKRLAREIVRMYHSAKAAQRAEKEFEQVFQKGQPPVYDILIYRIKPGRKNIVDLLTETKLAPSRSEAKRLVEQGGVEVDGKKISDIRYQASVKDGMIIRAGKRKFIKLKVS